MSIEPHAGATNVISAAIRRIEHRLPSMRLRPENRLCSADSP